MTVSSAAAPRGIPPEINELAASRRRLRRRLAAACAAVAVIALSFAIPAPLLYFVVGAARVLDSTPCVITRDQREQPTATCYRVLRRLDDTPVDWLVLWLPVVDPFLPAFNTVLILDIQRLDIGPADSMSSGYLKVGDHLVQARRGQAYVSFSDEIKPKRSAWGTGMLLACGT